MSCKRLIWCWKDLEKSLNFMSPTFFYEPWFYKYSYLKNWLLNNFAFRFADPKKLQCHQMLSVVSSVEAAATSTRSGRRQGHTSRWTSRRAPATESSPSSTYTKSAPPSHRQTDRFIYLTKKIYIVKSYNFGNSCNIKFDCSSGLASSSSRFKGFQKTFCTPHKSSSQHIHDKMVSLLHNGLP